MDQVTTRQAQDEPVTGVGLLDRIAGLVAAAGPAVHLRPLSDGPGHDIALRSRTDGGFGAPHGRLTIRLLPDGAHLTVTEAMAELGGARSYTTNMWPMTSESEALELASEVLLRHLAGLLSTGSAPVTGTGAEAEDDDDVFQTGTRGVAPLSFPQVEALLASSPGWTADSTAGRLTIRAPAATASVIVEAGRFLRGPADQPWRQVPTGDGVSIETLLPGPDGDLRRARVLHVPDGSSVERLLRAELLRLGLGSGEGTAPEVMGDDLRPSMVQSVFQDIFAQTREAIQAADDRVQSTHREIRKRLDVVEGLLTDLVRSIGSQNCRIVSEPDMVTFKLWPKQDAPPGRQEVRFEVRTQLRIYDRDVVDIPGYTFKQVGGLRRYYSFEERFEDSAGVMIKLMEAVAFEVAKAGPL